MSGRHLDPDQGDGLQLVRLIGSIIAIGLGLFLILWVFTSGDDDPPEDSPVAVDTTGTDIPEFTAPRTTVPVTTAVPPTTAAITTSTPPATGATTTTIAARPPGEVRVVVLNAEGTAGLAGATSEELAELGYQMGQADDFGELIETSRLVHAPGFAREAFVLGEEFPDAEVVEGAELAEEWGADVVVVLGASHEP